MSIVAGTRLGSYEVVAQIGAGGMGEVYEARDTKLGRSVAIKVLPTAFANNAERLARFQREAKVLASLNHPNIATIHGLEHSDGVDFLIMELVAGETLAERVKAGPVPVEEALKIAAQIAEALEAAHEKNIIHRDLKPANVKVTPEGKVKVLDFGLAKAFTDDEGTSNPANSPTLSQAATMQGVILGTAAYMSPEQARGKSVDKRTDIWAFGCVLYELLTGWPAFDGEDTTDILAAVVRAEPDFAKLPEGTPPNIATLLRRCLRKDRRQRLPDAAAARIEIEDALNAPPTVTAAAPEVRAGAIWRWALVSGLACLIIGAAATALIFGTRGREEPREVMRALISVAPADEIARSSVAAPRPTRTSIALSPDGKYLVFSASKGGKQQLYLRAMDQLEATPIAGTEGSNSPFISPDGRWLGFWQGEMRVGALGELKKAPISGGPAVTICKTTPLYGASWGADDTIVFSISQGSGLWRVSAGGGSPQQLTTLETKNGEYSHRLPQVLPGVKSVLFTIQKAFRRWDDTQIVALSLATGERKLLVEGGADARYVPTGHLVYAKGGTLMAVPFDLAQLQVRGSPFAIIEGIMQDENSAWSLGDTGAAQFSVSDSGALAYLPGGIFPDAQRQFVWVDRSGASQPLPLPTARWGGHPRLSPDGSRLAFYTPGTDQNVWIYEMSRGTLSRLTTEGRGVAPIWTPDGKRITFASTTSGQNNLFWKSADGSGMAERLTTSEYSQFPSSWSPDGKTLAFFERENATTSSILTLSLEGGRAIVRPFVQTPFYNEYPEFSSDGHWLAYVSDESGRPEVYVQPYPGPGARLQVSTGGGLSPAWSHDGREMFYTLGVSGDLKVMAVDVTLQPTFTAGKPHQLFEGRYANSTPIRGYEVTPDGRRFLMDEEKEQAPEPAITEVILVQNWFEELKRHVPAGK